MKRREGFIRICERVGRDPTLVRRAIKKLDNNGVWKCGPCKITLHHTRQAGRKTEYMLSLHEGVILVTKAYVVIDS